MLIKMQCPDNEQKEKFALILDARSNYCEHLFLILTWAASD